MNNPISHQGLAGRIAAAFISSKLTPLIIVASILLGFGAILQLPREEEPQIKVPMIDVMVSMPGFSAREVEERATRPMEKLLWEIPGVEYVYSTSRPGESLVIVRFFVGEDVERSLVKLNQKLQSNFDRIPPGVSYPLIKPRSIDDVPILAIALHSKRYDHFTLRRIAAELDDAIKQVPDIAETTIIGGQQRSIRVLFDPVKLASRNLTPASVAQMLRLANREFSAGSLVASNQDILIETGGFLHSPQDVAAVVIGVFNGNPVYLHEVAEIKDGADDPQNYVLFGRAGNPARFEEPAITLTAAKRPGANAIVVAENAIRKVNTLKGVLIPSDVEVSVTRNYGETAAEKSNELLLHMAFAVLSVSALIWLTLGWRESLIVAVAIPSTLALTLLTFYLFGFTLNRITLFALIFSIGILVDDAIVVLENIVRHLRLEHNKQRSWSAVAVEAVAEVGNPTILATFAVIAAVLPMAFVGGMMGPYMRPIPIGASAAMFFSLGIAFIATPWAAVRILKWHGGVDKHAAHSEGEEDFFTRAYRRAMDPLINQPKTRVKFLGIIVLLLLLAFGLVLVKFVSIKMLPFDNKSEFQIILNMPEGTALERTTAAAREIGQAISKEPEVVDYQVYAGIASPFNFNGLVRHYYMRSGGSVADIQVNLLPKSKRAAQSHEIAKRIRPGVKEIAAKYGASIAVAEVPPGPPVLQTLVTEIYGPTENDRFQLAKQVKGIYESTPGVVDTDWYVEEDRSRFRFVIDKEKAALNGISAQTIADTLHTALSGAAIDLVHQSQEKEDVKILLKLPQNLRTNPEELLSLRIRSGDANALPEPGRETSGPPLVPLRELVRLERRVAEKSIYHKNLLPVTYVTGDVAGEIESPVYAIFSMNSKLSELPARQFGAKSDGEIPIYNAVLPFSDLQPAIKWDGEWHITVEVFRDLGIAFAVVLVLIYVLMVGWFGSFITPLIVMAAIPFSLIGILPAHGLMGAFFTATSMIGFMAGAGIVVRNSIILVDFIELRIGQGVPLAQAVVDAGAVRFRPMLLTAMAVIAGAAVILFDPIFQGLALSLMAGEVASLLISRMAVPVLYYAYNKKRN